MGSDLLISSTICEYIRASPGVLSHMAMESAGEALTEGEPLAALGALTVLALLSGIVSILAEMVTGEWNSRPRSLFSYQIENGENSD